MKVAAQVTMDCRWNGKRLPVRSYLPELLDLAFWTGHRIGAIRQLQYCDFQLDEGPHGAIRWPVQTDKTGKPHTVPMNEPTRAAVRRAMAARPGVGKAYLFPSPTDRAEPIKPQLVRDWLLRAETLAGLPKLGQGCWHPYRRGFASMRKDMPIVDLARAGGWAESGETIRRCYQHPDEATLREVVDVGVERWREAIGS